MAAPSRSTAAPTAAAEVERRDRETIALSERIHRRILKVANAFRRREPPPDALHVVPRSSTPEEALFFTPQPPPPATLASRLRSALAEATALRRIEEERSAARRSPRDERARQQEILEELETGRVEIPLSEIARGIADRATGSRLGATPDASTPIPRTGLTVADRFRHVSIDLGRFEPFRSVSESLRRLDELSGTHFSALPARHGTQRTGGAPEPLHPVALQLGVAPWPHIAIAKHLSTEFLARLEAEVGADTRELHRRLAARVAEIERFPAIGEGPEASGSTRA